MFFGTYTAKAAPVGPPTPPQYWSGLPPQVRPQAPAPSAREAELSVLAPQHSSERDENFLGQRRHAASM